MPDTGLTMHSLSSLHLQLPEFCPKRLTLVGNAEILLVTLHPVPVHTLSGKALLFESQASVYTLENWDDNSVFALLQGYSEAYRRQSWQ